MTTDKKQFSIVRKFKATKQEVFNAFAQPEAMAQWWGPAGMAIVVSKFEFKTNGKFHYKMSGFDKEMWGIFHYHTIIEPDKIEFVNSFSNEKEEICKAPFDMDFPLEIFNEITFIEENGFTTLTLQGHPINATAAQEATYYSITENMTQGFNGTFNQLENYLIKK